MNFARGECTFCFDCVNACQSGALSKGKLTNSLSEPWTYKATIGVGCLSANGVTCRVCGDVCDTQAIKFRLAIGGKAFPEVTLINCTGCGACVAPCPTKAITIETPEFEEIERRDNA